MLRKEKFFTDLQLTNIKQRARQNLALHPRNYAMILTALYTGARASEVVNIRPEDLNPDRSAVFIRGLKNSRDREPVIPQFLMQVLLTLPRHKSGRLFGPSYRQFHNIFKSFATREKSLHALRHGLAIQIAQREKDPLLVQQVLGHKSFTSTQVYLDHVWSVERLKKALPPEDR